MYACVRTFSKEIKPVLPVGFNDLVAFLKRGNMWLHFVLANSYQVLYSISPRRLLHHGFAAHYISFFLAGGASSLFSFAPTKTLNMSMCSWYHEWSPWRSCYIMDTLKGMFTHWPCGLLPFFSKLWLPTKVMYKRYKCFNVQSKYVCVWTFSKEVNLYLIWSLGRLSCWYFPSFSNRERLDLFGKKVLHHLIDPSGDY